MGGGRRFKAIISRTRQFWDRRPIPTPHSDVRFRLQTLPGIPGRVDPRDQMLVGRSDAEIAHYRQVGVQVLSLVDEGLKAGGLRRGDIATWLDFGCGYGRVTRFLVQVVPPECVWCFDIDPVAVRFCSKEFGAHALFEHPKGLHFDVIVAISVVTHLGEADIERFFREAAIWLNPRGILLFTFHGDRAIDVLRDPHFPLHAHVGHIEADVREKGFAFRPYETGTDCGTTWHSVGYLRELVASASDSQLEELVFTPAGLDNHQDVIVFQRREDK